MADFILSEEGAYKGTIIAHSLKKSSSGTPYIELMVRLTARENIDLELEPIDPISRPTPLWLTPGARDNTKRNLQNLGFMDESLVRVDPNHEDAHSFKGREVFLTCVHEEYQGKNREKWNLQRRVLPADADTCKAIVADADNWYADVPVAAELSKF